MIRSVTLKRIRSRKGEGRDDDQGDQVGHEDPDLARLGRGEAVVEQPLVAEDPGGEHPDHPADAVAGEDVERVVEGRLCPEVDGHVADDAGGQADDDALADGDETGGRGDRHQADHGADAGAEGRGLLAPEPVEEDPAEHRGGRGRVRRREGQPAGPLAASAEPALKPNQPNQSIPVPRITNGTLAGRMGSFLRWLLRRPSRIAPASAAQPADMCTTVPPAKSFTPILWRKPSGCQVQCASGE